ncbi:hypothetical protein LX36DRAFT_736327 [Colletotrichum falcatum]|nr:hypothetical protein LX36DRAFT_736327 [Colletotrichum falcatum]
MHNPIIHGCGSKTNRARVIFGRWCYVKADSNALARAPKVWIPESLWDNPENTIASYVGQHLRPEEPASSALRLGQISHYPDGYIQVLIPTSMVQSNTLNTYARCWEHSYEVPRQQSVNYESWRNIRT